MKRMILSVFVMCTWLSTAIRAQVINGDLNHNDVLDVGDVTMVIDGYLTGETETIQTGGAPYDVDNSLVVGTWYASANEKVTFNADGTTDYANGYTYEFLPTQGYVLFYDATGTPVEALYVVKATSECLIFLPAGSKTPVRYTSTQPVSITLSQTSLELKPDEFARLTATVEPSSAGAVSWSSSDERVATVVSGFVTAVAEGTAIITASVAGSTATCTVTVTSVAPVPEHEAVDLGLSVKWATMNVGANAPEEYGDYFAWGETEPKDNYSWETYKLCKGSETTLTKYCTKSDYGTVDNKTVLDLEDDAAHANWSGTWRMPTYDEYKELVDKCTTTWTSLNGVYGRKVTVPSGNSIFLPAAGCRYGSSLSGAGSNGNYWSSSLYTGYPLYGWYLDFYSSGFYVYNYYYRCYGQSVRAVCQ